jgi:hypothetical protein
MFLNGIGALHWKIVYCIFLFVSSLFQLLIIIDNDFVIGVLPVLFFCLFPLMYSNVLLSFFCSAILCDSFFYCLVVYMYCIVM